MKKLAKQAVDMIASALGAYLRAWLRLLLYAFLGLLAGFALGDPARIGGTVLGVAFVAEMVPAIFSAFVDWQTALVTLYVWVWWPFRITAGNGNPFGEGEIPTESQAAARAYLLQCARH